MITRRKRGNNDAAEKKNKKKEKKQMCSRLFQMTSSSSASAFSAGIGAVSVAAAAATPSTPTPAVIRRVVHISCPVHRNIYLYDFQQQIVATPQFQRLHRLKQLGSAYNVYPSATHSRFSHCLGVGHLAGQLYDNIIAEQPELRAIAHDIDRKLVVAAGMMHDLGHGPNSHSFELWVHRAHPHMRFHHENMSIQQVYSAYRQGALPFLDEEDKSDPNDAKRSTKERAEMRLKAIAHMIAGTPHENVEDDCIAPEKRWILDIVANSMTGLDVDKCDYLLRDPLVVFGNMPSSINIDRILKMARVVSGRICFHKKVALNLYQLLTLRLNMHQQVYSHKTCIAVELMQRDVLDDLDRVLNISERLSTPESYMLLDDSIFQTARFLHQQTAWVRPKQADGANATDLALARALRILDDIDARRLYKCVTSVIVDGATWKKRAGQEGIPNVKEIFASIQNETLSKQLSVDDLVIETRCFNFGKAELNPMSLPMFFDWEDSIACRVRPKDVSYILPKQFFEYKIMLFCKRHDLTKELMSALEDAFNRCMSAQIPSPPSMPPSLACSSASFSRFSECAALSGGVDSTSESFYRLDGQSTNEKDTTMEEDGSRNTCTLSTAPDDDLQRKKIRTLRETL